MDAGALRKVADNVVSQIPVNIKNNKSGPVLDILADQALDEICLAAA